MKTTAYRIAGVPRKSIKPEPDRDYLAFIRRQQCCVSGSWIGVEAAHFGPRGLRQKANDAQALPLSRAYHRTRADSYHALGPVKFARVHNLDIPKLIGEYQALYLAESKPRKKPISRVRLTPADLMEEKVSNG